MSLRKMFPDNRTQEERWESAIDKCIETLNTEGFLSIANDTMAEEVAYRCGMHDAKCFMIKEGLAEHIILNKKGALGVKDQLIREQKKIMTRPYRLIMNNIALQQVEVLIEILD